MAAERLLHLQGLILIAALDPAERRVCTGLLMQAMMRLSEHCKAFNASASNLKYSITLVPSTQINRIYRYYSACGQQLTKTLTEILQF